MWDELIGVIFFYHLNVQKFQLLMEIKSLFFYKTLPGG